MDATTVDKRIAALVAGDNLIQTRLAELEAKFNAWLAAMKPGQELLREAVRRLRTTSEADAAPRVVEPAREREAPTESLPLETDAALDDERLLATLDPETANVIRVKRRLSKDKRSVRELLDEIQATRSATGRSAAQRKRWWRRGDE